MRLLLLLFFAICVDGSEVLLRILTVASRTFMD